MLTLLPREADRSQGRWLMAKKEFGGFSGDSEVNRDWVILRSVQSGVVKVPRTAVQTVIVDSSQAGGSWVKLIGAAGEIGKLKTATKQAMKMQEWLLKELAAANKGQMSPDGLWRWDGKQWQAAAGR